MKNNKKNFSSILKTIAQDRERTNILRTGEQNLIAYLVQRVPSWLTSDGLTFIGLFGNVFVGVCFFLAAYLNNPIFLLISLPGFLINSGGTTPMIQMIPRMMRMAKMQLATTRMAIRLALTAFFWGAGVPGFISTRPLFFSTRAAGL